VRSTHLREREKEKERTESEKEKHAIERRLYSLAPKGIPFARF